MLNLFVVNRTKALSPPNVCVGFFFNGIQLVLILPTETLHALPNPTFKGIFAMQPYNMTFFFISYTAIYHHMMYIIRSLISNKRIRLDKTVRKL